MTLPTHIARVCTQTSPRKTPPTERAERKERPMRYGVTNKHTTGHFSLRDSFDIPKGTRVVFGALDCGGVPFEGWTLPEKVARDLSGNEHDAAHRFVVVHPDNVTEA
jgi:hypothetical protein